MAEEARQHADEARADIETLQSQLVGDASADANSEYTAALRRLAAAQQTTTEAGAALGRLDVGTYGICRGCGGTIPEGRLDLRPHTPYCVDCS
jgi:RNA polymerase-binding transcription factor DksA